MPEAGNLEEIGDLCEGCTNCDKEAILIEVTVTVLTQIEEKTVEVEEYSTVQAVLEVAGIEYGPDAKFYIDDDEASLDTEVWYGENVKVVVPSTEKE